MKKLLIKPKSFFKILETTPHSQVAEMVLSPGQSTGGSENEHKRSDQWLYVISGSGKAIIEGKTIKIKKGELLLIERGEKHEIINDSEVPLETFNIYAPSEY